MSALAWDSLRWRLPLFIAAVIVAAVGPGQIVHVVELEGRADRQSLEGVVNVKA